MFQAIIPDERLTRTVPAVHMLPDLDIELALTTHFGQPRVQQTVRKTMLTWHFVDAEARAYLLVGKAEDWSVYGPDPGAVGGFTHWLGNILQRTPHLLGKDVN